MNRLALVALLTLLPAVAGAQAIRCKDPATGKILYTDQPCQGGQLVVPPRTAEEQRRDAESAAAARGRPAAHGKTAARPRLSCRHSAATG